MNKQGVDKISSTSEPLGTVLEELSAFPYTNRREREETDRQTDRQKKEESSTLEYNFQKKITKIYKWKIKKYKAHFKNSLRY